MAEVLGILADDLTGAGDSIVQFAGAGLPGLVVFDINDLPAWVRVLAVDSDSRGLSVEKAREAAILGVSKLKRMGAQYIYKKVDSTLRGNLAAELDAVISALESPFVLVAPAYPANQRITAGGFHLVRQVPVGESETALDPVSPATQSFLPVLLRAGTRRPVGLLDLSIYADGQDALFDKLDQMRSDGIQVVSCDATTDRHLDMLAAYLKRNPDTIGCGSAGLARALAGGMTSSQRRPQWVIDSAAVQAPVLVVAGSRSQITHVQLHEFISGGASEIAIDSETLLGPDADQAVAGLVNLSLALLDSNKDVVLSLAPGEVHPGASGYLAACLGRAAAQILATDVRVCGTVLTGGDTAKAVCHALGVTAIEYHREVYPAVPIGRMLGGLRHGLPIVTKGGGCGGKDILSVAVHWFREGGGS